jgi:dipeptidyl aminopeptidase/acylaminoacyl peptidase
MVVGKIIAACLLVCATAAPCIAEPISVSKALDQRRLSDLQFSADGKRLAFVVEEPARGAEKTSHIWVFNVDTGDLRQFTFSQAVERLPRWSPDGTRLAFLSTRDGAPKLYVVPRDGGEAQPLLNVAQRIETYAWSPDGRAIAFRAAEPPSDATKKRIAEKDDARAISTPVIRDPAQLPRLWVVRLATEGRAGQDQPTLLGAPGWELSEFVWKDTGHLLVAGSPTPSEFAPSSALWEAPVDGSAWTKWADPPQPFHDIRMSPDGAYLAFTASTNRGQKAWSLFVYDNQGRNLRNLTASLDRMIAPVQWTGANQIIAGYQDGFRDKFISISPSGTTTPLANPVASGDVAGASNGAIAWQGGSSTQLPELWVQRPGGQPRQVSHFHDSWKEIALPSMEIYRYRSFDGLEIEGALMRPAVKGKVPLIVYVHGGPSSRWRDQYDAFEAWGPLLVKQGYAVFFPNPRGSSGYTERFMQANRGDWGGADFKDVMAGVDDLVRRGVADPDHLGICGWSYGGYMAAWAVTQTTRFRAAVVGAPVTDLMSEIGVEPGPRADGWYLGLPYEHGADYLRMSPVAQVSHARTPTLLLQGEADTEDPVGQALEFYRGLKTYGVESEVVLYPREDHVFREEKHLTDMFGRILDWFQKYL